jgi:hypothetical protein
MLGSTEAQISEVAMKRTIAAFVFVTLISSLALHSQTPALKLGLEHKKLNVWVGNWTYETDIQATPLGPAGKYPGEMTAKLILGGFFVEFRGGRKDIAGSHKNWYEIDGYDALQKKFTMVGWASDGSTYSGTFTFDGTTMNYSGTLLIGEKQYKIRGSIVLSADFMSCVEKRDISVDGRNWIPHFQIKFVKTK